MHVVISGRPKDRTRIQKQHHLASGFRFRSFLDRAPERQEVFREKAPGAGKAAAGVHSEAMAGTIDYQTDPSRYRHWRIERDGDIAYLIMDVDQTGGLGDYELKLNSYDLGVDIELNDAVQRLRFWHPEVG